MGSLHTPRVEMTRAIGSQKYVPHSSVGPAVNGASTFPEYRRSRRPVPCDTTRALMRTTGAILQLRPSRTVQRSIQHRSIRTNSTNEIPPSGGGRISNLGELPVLRTTIAPSRGKAEAICGAKWRCDREARNYGWARDAVHFAGAGPFVWNARSIFAAGRQRGRISGTV